MQGKQLHGETQHHQDIGQCVAAGKRGPVPPQQLIPVKVGDKWNGREVQIRGLVKGGVDLLLFETCFDALNTKAALYAIGHIPEASDIPIMISASMSDRSGRTLTGQTMEAFYRSVQHCSPLSSEPLFRMK